MYKYALITLAILNFAICEEKTHKKPYVDPFSMLDQHITNSLAYHYYWPWSQLIRAAATLELEESLDPKIISDTEKYQINLAVRRFKPEELKIKVKNRHIIVEGKHKDYDNKFMTNHFVQRFVLPVGTKQEEVTAVFNEKGVLVITAPKHEVPPPPPERDVPIEVILPEDKTEIPEQDNKDQDNKEHDNKEQDNKAQDNKAQDNKEQDNKETNPPSPQTSAAPLEQIETEATTHIGKIRKKELKTTTKTTKDNEVTKGIDGNGLDYALIETDE